MRTLNQAIFGKTPATRGINNEIVSARSSGVKDAETGELVIERTLFHLASVSKSFVGIAIMQLVQQGKIGLDHRVVEYLPYFTLADER